MSLDLGSRFAVAILSIGPLVVDPAFYQVIYQRMEDDTSMFIVDCSVWLNSSDYLNFSFQSRSSRLTKMQ